MAGRPVDGLTPAQEQALAALLKEPTITLAARSSGISESNIYRWLKEPLFKSAYREARREALSHSIGLIQQCVPHAVQCLMNLVKDPSCPHATKATASGMLIKFGRESIEMDELVERVEALEATKEKPL